MYPWVWMEIIKGRHGGQGTSSRRLCRLCLDVPTYVHIDIPPTQSNHPANLDRPLTPHTHTINPSHTSPPTPPNSTDCRTYNTTGPRPAGALAAQHPGRAPHPQGGARRAFWFRSHNMYIHTYVYICIYISVTFVWPSRQPPKSHLSPHISRYIMSLNAQ